MASALILTFPRAKKRGRKVTKGPKASVHVIYECDGEPGPTAEHLDREARYERVAELLVARKLREERELAAMRANPKFVMFSDFRVYREGEERTAKLPANPEIDRLVAILEKKVGAKYPIPDGTSPGGSAA